MSSAKHSEVSSLLEENKKLIHKKEATFESEARLLEELGERLVANADVAIVEIIKNAYDADAAECSVAIEEGKQITIKDNGHGITESEFINKWMRIATGSKQKDVVSRKYERKLTGAKGIGRFAVRFLGDVLTLQTISYDKQLKKKTLLEASFEWKNFSVTGDLQGIKIPYKLFSIPDSEETGTTIIIHKLHAVTKDVYKEIRSKVLEIVSPLKGLDPGRFLRKDVSTAGDPGFQVNLIGETGEGQPNENLAQEVLKNYWLRLNIDLSNGQLNYKIYGRNKTTPIFTHKEKNEMLIKEGLIADVRFFPRRAGIFSQKDFNGRDAWTWVREKSGVKVIDHGFMIRPYGFTEDDWLKNSQDAVVNARNWRSEIMKKHYPMEAAVHNDPGQNPMLYLPTSHQLVGAIFVESGMASKSKGLSNLVPAMDREGFLDNEAFRNLVEIVRAGIEMLALTDKKEQDLLLKKIADEETQKARQDIKKAISHIKQLPSLTESDKNRVISEFSNLAENIEKTDEYNRRARQNLETMSLLGVVAGFMTHESKKILANLKDVVEELQKLSKKHKEVAGSLTKIQESYREFSGYVDYTSTFITAVHHHKVSSFKTAPQVDRVLEKFGRNFVENFNIQIIKEIDAKLETPSIPITVYSGVLLNLYTNALKAIMAGAKDPENPKILIRAKNEGNKHILEIADTGVGIPHELRERIWDPLFTTTSNLNNPLGTGMGLGLNLVKELLKSMHGNIRLVEPPKDYSTCFRVEFTNTGGKHA